VPSVYRQGVEVKLHLFLISTPGLRCGQPHNAAALTSGKEPVGLPTEQEAGWDPDPERTVREMSLSPVEIRWV
jgi:hypothetical protein